MPLSDFVGKAEEFDAIFYVGGHGRMYPTLFPLNYSLFSKEKLY